MIAKRPYIDKTDPDTYKALVKTSAVAKKTFLAAGLEAALLEIINTRVSQINACVTCLSIHAAEARKAGVSQLKLDVLPAWRDTDLFDDKERAALLLAESLTTLNPSEDRDVTTAFVQEFFTPEQVTALEWAIILIGAFNRVSIASGHPPIVK